MRNSSDVKDKNIRLENLKFRACVEYYNGSSIDCGLFESIKGAQKVLDKYPRDVWCEYDMEDFRYKEVDSKHWKRKNIRHALQDLVDSEDRRPRQTGGDNTGRTFGGPVSGRG